MQNGALTACEECGGTEWIRVQDNAVVCANCGGPRATQCEYKAAHCSNPATTTVDAPALRDLFPEGIPACESCAAFVEAIK